MKAQEHLKQNKSTVISFGVHATILLFSFMPMVTKVHEELTLDTFEHELYYEIPVEFGEFANSGEEGKKAASPNYDPEVKPVVHDENKAPAIHEAEKISEETQAAEEPAEAIESEVTAESDTEVLAAEQSTSGDAEETTSPGGSDATVIEGNSEGTAAEGDGDGINGDDGDGVISRRIIYREDITQAAEYSGTIAINLCIDRRGHVISVSKNAERTTITNSDIVRKAMDIASRYRFESNYSAARRECGTLTFIFDIEEEVQEVYVGGE